MLELVAMITMLADHLGKVFWPDQMIWQIIGRVAMPLYCWGLVQGVGRTRSWPRYALRLLLVALTAQPFYYGLGWKNLNMGFTLLFGLLLLVGLDRTKKWFQRSGQTRERLAGGVLRGLIVVAGFLIFGLLPLDYGWYAWALLLIYRYLKAPLALLGAHAVLNALGGGPFQAWSLVATALLILPVTYRPLMRGRWVYRSFYPAHLAVLFLASRALIP